MQSLSRNNIGYLGSEQRAITLPGLLCVLIIHAGLFYFLWHQRLTPPPEQMVALFANLITLPPPVSVTEPPVAKPQPVKKPAVVKPKQERLAAKAPVTSKQDAYVEPSPAPPAAEQTKAADPVVAPPAPMQTGPVALAAELSVSCSKLTAPVYPAISRRMGEEGKVELRVELDENGRVDTINIINSSGYQRLDAAALAAVKSWQCNPSLRNGQPVRAVALQPFNFVLQGNE
ncbi:MAG: energy transducer TonB [Nitrosomonas sp.]|nr:MAG: energy transducer TonB [Nitrosomonas sp.]